MSGTQGTSPSQQIKRQAGIPQDTLSADQLAFVFRCRYPEAYFVNGPEDFRILLHYLPDFNEDETITIIARSYVHTEALQIRREHGELKAFIFDPQALHNRFYPHRHYIAALAKHFPGIQISTNSNAVQDINAIGCYAYVDTFCDYYVTRGHNIFDETLETEHVEIAECDVSFRTFNTDAVSMTNKKMREKRVQLSQITDIMDACDNTLNHTQVLIDTKRNINFDQMLFEISITETIDGAYRLNINDNNHTGKDSDRPYSNFFKYTDADFPHQLKEKSCNTFILADGEYDDERYSLFFEEKTLEELVEKMNIIDIDMMRHQGMHQTFALQQLAHEVNLQLEYSLECERIKRAGKLGGLTRHSVSNAIAESLEGDNIAVIPLSNVLSEQGTSLFDYVDTLYTIHKGILPEWLFMSYDVGKQHQILLAIDTSNHDILYFYDEEPSIAQHIKTYLEKKSATHPYSIKQGDNFEVQTLSYSCGIRVYYYALCCAKPEMCEKAFDADILLPTIVRQDKQRQQKMNTENSVSEQQRLLKVTLSDYLNELAANKPQFLLLIDQLNADRNPNIHELIRSRSLLEFSKYFFNINVTEDIRSQWETGKRFLKLVLLLIDKDCYLILSDEIVSNCIALSNSDYAYYFLLEKPNEKRVSVLQTNFHAEFTKYQHQMAHDKITNAIRLEIHNLVAYELQDADNYYYDGACESKAVKTWLSEHNLETLARAFNHEGYAPYHRLLCQEILSGLHQQHLEKFHAGTNLDTAQNCQQLQQQKIRAQIKRNLAKAAIKRDQERHEFKSSIKAHLQDILSLDDEILESYVDMCETIFSDSKYYGISFDVLKLLTGQQLQFLHEAYTYSSLKKVLVQSIENITHEINDTLITNDHYYHLALSFAIYTFKSHLVFYHGKSADLLKDLFKQLDTIVKRYEYNDINYFTVLHFCKEIFLFLNHPHDQSVKIALEKLIFNCLLTVSQTPLDLTERQFKLLVKACINLMEPIRSERFDTNYKNLLIDIFEQHEQHNPDSQLLILFASLSLDNNIHNPKIYTTLIELITKEFMTRLNQMDLTNIQPLCDIEYLENIIHLRNEIHDSSCTFGPSFQKKDDLIKLELIIFLSSIRLPDPVLRPDQVIRPHMLVFFSMSSYDALTTSHINGIIDTFGHNILAVYIPEIISMLENMGASFADCGIPQALNKVLEIINGNNSDKTPVAKNLLVWMQDEGSDREERLVDDAGASPVLAALNL